jgi:hypothetical protein
LQISRTIEVSSGLKPDIEVEYLARYPEKTYMKNATNVERENDQRSYKATRHIRKMWITKHNPPRGNCEYYAGVQSFARLNAQNSAHSSVWPDE